jgi:hypothetical protein
VRFQEAERALCRDGGVGLCQAGWGFVFVLKLGENSALLSDKLKAIIEKHEQHWDELVQLLLDFRSTIETNHKQQAEHLGLSKTQYAFHNILMTEIARVRGNESIDQATHEEVIAVTKDLVGMLDEATDIVNFFSKQDEVKRMKTNIKRRIVESSFDDPAIRTAVLRCTPTDTVGCKVPDMKAPTMRSVPSAPL